MDQPGVFWTRKIHTSRQDRENRYELCLFLPPETFQNIYFINSF